MRVSTPRLMVLVTLGFAPAAAAADCNGNGVPDIEEVRSGALPDCNGNGVPDSCDIEPVNYGLASSGSFFAGQSPFEILVDDLDGDGDVDVATSSNEGNEQVTVLWNNGRGRFTTPTRWPVGQAAMYLVAADLDFDGVKDLAVGGNVGLTVLFQDRDRTFSSRAPVLALGTGMIGLTGGDLDSDSDTDIAVVVDFGVRVLRNEGGGLFDALDPMTMGSAPAKILAATLDGDEDLDLATCNLTGGDRGNVSIFINRGDGSFEIPRNYATVRDPGTLVSGDLDGDGDEDLAAANEELIEILVGDGQGRFTQSNQLMSEMLLWRLASADLDGDGNLDLAACGGQTVVPAGISVFLNHGRAELARLVDFETGIPSDIGAGDMDGDGALDLVVGDLEHAAVTILQRSEVAYSTDCNSNLLPDDCELEGNDCNANEVPDECDVLSRSSPDCNRNGMPDECDIPGSGFGFETSLLRTTSFMRLLSSSDLDADGREDLFALTGPGDLIVFWNNRPEGLVSEVLLTGGSKITDTDAGDLDGDGDRDIVLADEEAEGLRIIENRGSRTFADGGKLHVPLGANMVSATDLDGDLDLDLAATMLQSGRVVVFVNHGPGAIGDIRSVGIGVSGRILEVADLDGDGLMDLVADGDQQDSLLIFWNDGSLAFTGPTALELGSSIQTAAIVDADGDGDRDIFLLAFKLVLFRNSGMRTFALEDLPSPIVGVGGMLAGDLDLDGDQDLAVMALNFVALLNRGGGTFDLPVAIAPVSDASEPMAGGDWNGDGAMDLAVGYHANLLSLTNVSRPPVSKDLDANGVPDECQSRPFHRADANGDGDVNLTDPIFTLRHLFLGEPAPPCLEAADTNNDTRLGITDPIATLDFLFRSGPPPAPPGPPPATCGLDTDEPGSAGDIGCGSYESC